MSDLFSHIDNSNVFSHMRSVLKTKGMKESPTDLKTDFVQTTFDLSSTPDYEVFQYQINNKTLSEGNWDSIPMVLSGSDFCFDIVADFSQPSTNPDLNLNLAVSNEYHYLILAYSYDIDLKTVDQSCGHFLMLTKAGSPRIYSVVHACQGIHTDDQPITIISDNRVLFASNGYVNHNILTASNFMVNRPIALNPVYVPVGWGCRLALVRSQPDTFWNAVTPPTAYVYATVIKAHKSVALPIM